METLTYCPKCGDKNLNWDGEKKWFCKCGFSLYNNVAAAVAVVITCGNEILFTKRNQEPKKGKLDLAGGFVDPKENAEYACKREIMEELQLQIDEKKLQYLASLPNLYHYKGIDYNTLDIFFRYEVSEKFEVQLELSEISEVFWIPKDKIIIDEIAFESQKKFFIEFLSN